MCLWDTYVKKQEAQTHRRRIRNTECVWANKIVRGTHKQSFENSYKTPVAQLRAESSVEQLLSAPQE